MKTDVPDLIAELDYIDRTIELELRYEKMFGRGLVNVSHWDPGPRVSSRLKPLLLLPAKHDPIDYVYSYDLPHLPRLCELLGFDSSERSCLVTPNGTTSLFCAFRWARSQGFRRIHLARPAYFPAIYQARLMGIEVVFLNMMRTNNGYMMDDEGFRKLDSHDLLVLTSPVYTTGCYLSLADVSRLESFLSNGGYVIADECLAWPGTELGRRLGQYSGFVGLYCPHKAVSLNAFKFSVIVFARCFASSFEQWADILYGGLSLTNCLAIRHFLSPNFSDYAGAFLDYTRHQRLALVDVISRFDGVELDKQSEGHFLNAYWPNLDSRKGNDLGWIWKVMEKSGASFIPGIRNQMPDEVGFCFRINAARNDAQFSGAVGRLCAAVSSLTC